MQSIIVRDLVEMAHCTNTETGMTLDGSGRDDYDIEPGKYWTRPTTK
jgi:hypothetical protein